jgi:proteasome lid subunit RPN8/RPN11
MGKGPRIVKETRKRRLAVEPPPFEEHPWAPEQGDVRVFLSRDGADGLVGHCEAQAEAGVEALGFLAGGVFSWKGRSYTVVRDAVTTSLDASAISVRFNRDGFPDLFSKLDRLGYDYQLVGWYHSHPGYGCFMSETDVGTQRAGFPEAYHVALVVDPVRKEMRAFGARKEDMVELAIGIYDDRDWYWPGSRDR